MWVDTDTDKWELHPHNPEGEDLESDDEDIWSVSSDEENADEGDTSLCSLEVYVEHISNLNVKCTNASLAFRLLEYPIVLVQPDPRVGPPEEGAAATNILFRRGKSCLFKLPPDLKSRSARALPLYIMLVDFSRKNKRPKLLGSATSNLLEAAKQAVSRGPKGGYKSGDFVLYDSVHNEIGLARLNIRLVIVSNSVVPHLQELHSGPDPTGVHRLRKFHGRMHLPYKHMEKLLAASNLGAVGLMELYNAFPRKVRLDLREFTHIMHLRLGVNNSHLVESLFRVFDKDNSGFIDINEFLAGLSVIVRGSFSDKVTFAFRLYDMDGDNHITKQELYKFMKSFFVSSLAAIETLLQKYRELVINDTEHDDEYLKQKRLEFRQFRIREDLNPTKLWSIVDAVFKTYDLDRDGKLTLLEFKRWARKDARVTAWIEFLSMHTTFYHRGQKRQSELKHAFHPHPKSTVAKKEGTWKSTLKIDNMTAEDILATFAKLGRLTRDAFKDVMERKLGLTNVALVARLFDMLDTNKNGTVSSRELSALFSVFADGRIEQKCLAAFRAYDMDGDGYLSKNEMRHMMRTMFVGSVSLLEFLTQQGAFKSGLDDSQLTDAKALIDYTLRKIGSMDTIKEYADHAFQQADKNHDNRLSPQEFVKWSQSHPVVRRWMDLLGKLMGAGRKSAHDPSMVEEPAIDWKTQEKIRRLREKIIRARSGLRWDKVSPDEIRRAYDQYAGRGGLDERRFGHVMQSVLSVRDPELLSLMYRVFDANRDGRVGRMEFLCGTVLLCSGGWASKLKAAFHAADLDGSGAVSERELGNFLFAFLHMSCRAIAAIMKYTRDDDDVDLREYLQKVTSLTETSSLPGLVVSAMRSGQNGEIRLPEFQKWLRSNETLSEWLDILSDSDDMGPANDIANELRAENAVVPAVRRLLHIDGIGVEEMLRMFNRLERLDRRRCRDLVQGRLGIEDPRICDKLFDCVDTDRSGFVSSRELAAAIITLASDSPRNRFIAAFRAIDIDGHRSLEFRDVCILLRSFFALAPRILDGFCSFLGKEIDLHAKSELSKLFDWSCQRFQDRDLGGQADEAISRFGRDGVVTGPDLYDFLSENRTTKMWFDLARPVFGSGVTFGESKAAVSSAILRIRSKLRQARQAMNLSSVQPVDLQKAFERFAIRRDFLDRRGFEDVMGLCLGAKTGGDSSRIGTFCDYLWRVFDVNDDGAVDRVEFLAGTLMLCSGDGRTKCHAAFSAADNDFSGYLSERELGNFLNSFILTSARVVSTLVRLSNLQGDREIHEFVEKVDRLGDRRNINGLIRDAMRCGRGGELSFAEFIRWIMAQPTLADWIGALSDEDVGGVESEVDVPVGSLAGAVRSKVRLSEHSCEDLLKLFARTDRLDRRRFGEVMRARLGLHDEDVMADLFDMIDVDGNGFISSRELTATLGILCSDSPANKVAAAFKTFDVDGSGYLDKGEMRTMMRTFLVQSVKFLDRLVSKVPKTVLTDDTRADLTQFVEYSLRKFGTKSALLEHSDKAFDEMDTNKNGKVSCEEFIKWSQTHDITSKWLEFMDKLLGSSPAAAKPVEITLDGETSKLREEWLRIRQALKLSGLKWTTVETNYVQIAGRRGLDYRGFTSLFDTVLNIRDDDLLSLLFRNFDQVGDGRINRVDFLCGMALLTDGTWTEKIQKAYDIADVDGAGKLREKDLMYFLSSFFNISVRTINSMMRLAPDRPSADLERFLENMEFYTEDRRVPLLVQDAVKDTPSSSAGVAVGELEKWMMQEKSIKKLMLILCDKPQPPAQDEKAKSSGDIVEENHIIEEAKVAWADEQQDKAQELDNITDRPAKLAGQQFCPPALFYEAEDEEDEEDESPAETKDDQLIKVADPLLEEPKPPTQPGAKASKASSNEKSKLMEKKTSVEDQKSEKPQSSAQNMVAGGHGSTTPPPSVLEALLVELIGLRKSQGGQSSAPVAIPVHEELHAVPVRKMVPRDPVHRASRVKISDSPLVAPKSTPTSSSGRAAAGLARPKTSKAKKNISSRLSASAGSAIPASPPTTAKGDKSADKKAHRDAIRLSKAKVVSILHELDNVHDALLHDPLLRGKDMKPAELEVFIKHLKALRPVEETLKQIKSIANTAPPAIRALDRAISPKRRADALTDDERQDLRDKFARYDRNNVGSIQNHSVAYLLDDLHIRIERDVLTKVMKDLDRSGDGSVSFDDFVVWWVSSEGKRIRGESQVSPAEFQEVKRAFKRHDFNKDGIIPAKQLSSVLTSLNIRPTRDVLERAFEFLDKNNDSVVDFSTFLLWWGSKEGKRLRSEVCLPDEEVDTLRRYFDRYDRDKKNEIDRLDLASVFRDIGLVAAKSAIERAAMAMDNFGFGIVTFVEFVLWWCSKAGRKFRAEGSMTTNEWNEMRSIFDKHDRDRDGVVSRKNMPNLLTDLGMSSKMEELKQVINMLDRSGDGEIDIYDLGIWYGSKAGRGLRYESVLSDEERQKLEEIFKKYDRNGDGVMSASELAQLFDDLKIHVTRRELAEIMRDLDRNGDGAVDFKEFALWFAGKTGKTMRTRTVKDRRSAGWDAMSSEERERCKRIFQRYDRGDGKITSRTLAELIRDLGIRPTKEVVDEAMSTLDTNNDGVISFAEFSLWYAEELDRQEAGGPVGSRMDARTDPRQAGRRVDVPLQVERECYRVFSRYDEARGDYIRTNQLYDVLLDMRMRVDREELRRIIHELDPRGHNMIYFKDFLEWYYDRERNPPNTLGRGRDDNHHRMGSGAATRYSNMDSRAGSPASSARSNATLSDQEVKSIFQSYDPDRKGVIPERDIRTFLKEIGHRPTMKDISDLDPENKGYVKYRDFVKWWAVNKPAGDGEEPRGVSMAEIEREVRDVFDKYDRNRSGTIEKNELSRMLRDLGMQASFAEVREAMRVLDTNSDGRITFREFCSWWAKRKGPSTAMSTRPSSPASSARSNATLSDQEVKSIFQSYDPDRKGVIPERDIRTFLKEIGHRPTMKDISDLDPENKGYVKYRDFVKWWAVNKPAGDGEEPRGVSMAEIEREVRDVFDKYDRNRSGTIEKNELSRMLRDLGMQASFAEVREAMRVLDTNSDGRITFREFCSWWAKRKNPSAGAQSARESIASTRSSVGSSVIGSRPGSPAKSLPPASTDILREVRPVFMKHDPGRTGKVDVKELTAILTELNVKDLSRAVLQAKKQCDSGDGLMQFKEFCAWLQSYRAVNKSVASSRRTSRDFDNDFEEEIVEEARAIPGSSRGPGIGRSASPGLSRQSSRDSLVSGASRMSHGSVKKSNAGAILEDSTNSSDGGRKSPPAVIIAGAPDTAAPPAAQRTATNHEEIYANTLRKALEGKGYDQEALDKRVETMVQQWRERNKP